MTSNVRPLLAVMFGASALVLGACGAHGGQQQSRGSQAVLPRGVAQQLAAASDAVARELAAGQTCAALNLATSLRRQTIEAIDAGRVPVAFRRRLRSTTADLASRIRCVEPAPAQQARPIPRPAQHGHGNKGKHKGRGKRGGNDQGDEG